MKSFILFLGVCFLSSSAFSQTTGSKTNVVKEIQVAEVSCGKCKFGMDARTCSMAIRLDGKTYFVDGVSMDDYGDAHAHDGMCNAIRKAEVEGELADSRYKATSIKLLPDAKNSKKDKNN